MSKLFIGTPATRAAIIETLFARDYIRREKKSLVPTEKGLSVYETVKDKRIADVAMNGSWENALTQIERGETQPETFGKAIEVYTRQITAELLDTKISVAEENTCLCSRCKTSQVRFYLKVAKSDLKDKVEVVPNERTTSLILPTHIQYPVSKFVIVLFLMFL